MVTTFCLAAIDDGQHFILGRDQELALELDLLASTAEQNQIARLDVEGNALFSPFTLPLPAAMTCLVEASLAESDDDPADFLLAFFKATNDEPETAV